MWPRDARSLIFAGFVIALFGMIVGLFVLTTEVADPRKILIAFGVIFLIGVGLITAGKIRERQLGRS